MPPSSALLHVALVWTPRNLQQCRHALKLIITLNINNKCRYAKARRSSALWNGLQPSSVAWYATQVGVHAKPETAYMHMHYAYAPHGHVWPPVCMPCFAGHGCTTRWCAVRPVMHANAARSSGCTLEVHSCVA